MMTDANIITLYKNRGARRDCNNNQGISLLRIAMKLFARVVLKGLQVLAQRFYPESIVWFPYQTINTIRSNSLAEASPQRLQPLPLLNHPLGSHFLADPVFLFCFLTPFFCPYASKAEPFKFTQSYHFNYATCDPLSTNSSHPDVLQRGLPSLLRTI